MLMQTHHYRGFRTLAGRDMRYVATLDGRWVALLRWQAAAFQCRRGSGWPSRSPNPNGPMWVRWMRRSMPGYRVRWALKPWPSLAKVPKGAVRAEGAQVHLLSAFLHGQGVTIAGKVVTADALHTQRETAPFLVEDKKAEYLFTAVHDPYVRWCGREGP